MKRILSLLFLALILSCSRTHKEDNLDIIECTPISFVCQHSTFLMSFDAIVNEHKCILSLETGSPELTLDKEFVSSITNLDSLRATNLCTIETVNFSYIDSSEKVERIFAPIDIIIAGERLTYDYFFIIDLKEQYGVDGFFNIPMNYDKKLSFNFSAGTFNFTDNIDESNYDFSVTMLKDRYFTILNDFPIPFSPLTRTKLCVDTGTDIYSMSLLSNKLTECFSNLPYNHIFSENKNSYCCSIEENGEEFWIYTNDEVDAFNYPIIGLDLLIRYDICLDYENMTAWFKKNGITDSHTYFQTHGANLQNIWLMTNDAYNAAMIMSLDINGVPYQSGLRPFDVVKKVGGRAFNPLSPLYLQKCREDHTTCEFEIIRNGQISTIAFIP